ncbi:MAG: NTP transferase domain-containing protein [Chloroflexota bacterium]|jgi:molybdopterin-guanine dinucleotide biosynthesis protein A
MNCVVFAGGNLDPDDLLYPYTNGQPKALIQIGDKTMLEHVVCAMQDAGRIEEILVVGIGRRPGLEFRDVVDWIPDQGSLIDNGMAAIDWIESNWPESGHILFSTSDIPAIHGPVVDRFVTSCDPLDRSLYYPFVTKETLDARFPGSKRTFVRLGDWRVAGGDMIVSRSELARERRDLMESLVHGRKRPWKIAQIVGLGTLLKLFFNLLDLDEVEKTASRVIGQPVKVLVSTDAELAMDVDKPHQLELLREVLT